MAFSLVGDPVLQGCKMNCFTFPTPRLQYCYCEGEDHRFSNKARTLPIETQLQALFVSVKLVDAWLCPRAEKEYTLYQRLQVQANATQSSLFFFL